MRGTFSQPKKKRLTTLIQVINPLDPSESNVRDVINLLHKCDSITKKKKKSFTNLLVTKLYKNNSDFYIYYIIKLTPNLFIIDTLVFFSFLFLVRLIISLTFPT